MMIFAVALVVILTTLLTWWGYRCGAVMLLCREAIVLLVVALAYLSWYISGSVVVALIVVGAAGFVLPWCIAAFRRKRGGAAGEATGDPPVRHRRWLGRCDRLMGAGLGLISANACCYGLAIAGSSLVFSMSVDRLYADEYSEQHPEPQWVAYVGEASQALGWLGEFGLLNQVPRIDQYRKEINAVITLLNAPPDKVKWLVEKRELMVFYALPPVRAAIGDPTYLQRIERARGGDVSAILDLTRDQHTHSILKYPQVRALAQDVTPSQLLAELQAIPDDADH